jgi:CheY-like chemotaxis protein
MESYRILIVDDQRDIRRMLRAGLDTLGVKLLVVDVPSGEEAMLVITRQHFDLLITDVRLPGISGLELILQAKARNPGLKLILITGVSDATIRKQVVDAGADAFFFKPLDMADFLDAVERCLGLVETLLPPAPIIPESDDMPLQTLPERLSSLRQHVGAVSVVLLDERGRVMARAGDLPDAADETSLIPSLMAVISASKKVSRFLGKRVPDNLLFFAGEEYDLHVAPVGPTMALSLMSAAPLDDGKLNLILPAVRLAIKDLFAILEHMGVPVDIEVKAPVNGLTSFETESEEILPVLDEIFDQESVKKLKSSDVDEFWETLEQEPSDNSVINADALSYEQARRLGLAPDDE